MTETELALMAAAAMFGVRPETLSRALGELRDEGPAIGSGRHLVVPGYDRLIEATGALSWAHLR